ncbi:hypothetical protein [Croceicoccus marinus]|jgi:hypothetical protein|uniref:Uncharacterized protein n=1 Tax=Croceicoccus marinus TaxID=450378 RepID=A0A7G6VZX8_9SPHN|nr:hypothetical protein [Croceicoccus marinus]QNE07293.1 hypothetical protein H4O24_15390 [Croceicoccus marinus]
MFLSQEHSVSPMARAASISGDRIGPRIAPAPRLSTLERRVIEIARTDALDTLKPPRRHGWFVRLFLGRERASPALANERLEAIRRLSVLAWHHDANPPPRALGEARAAGLGREQIDEILALTRRSSGVAIEKTAP